MTRNTFCLLMALICELAFSPMRLNNICQGAKAAPSPAAPAAELDDGVDGGRAKPAKVKGKGKPTYTNDRATLPQDQPYQAQLYRWLKTLTLKDVEIPRQDLKWDGTVKDANEMANAQVTLAKIEPTFVINGESRWFVLNDGKGSGIEGAGNVRQLRWPSCGAMLYALSLPLADGGNGNPYCRNRALGTRVMIATAVDMMMLDDSHGKIGAICRSDFLGGTMIAWVYSYQHCQDVLDPATRQAFEAGFDRMLDKMLKWGPRDVTPNMDTRAIATVARLYVTVKNPAIQDKCLRIVKQFLFGSETGTLANVDSKRGIFYPAGYVGEGESPETTYNGVSLYYILEARAVTRELKEWAFLDEVLQRMLDFKLYQYFREPSGFVTGPAGYAGRTGAPYCSDQRNPVWRQFTAADMYVEGRPLAQGNRGEGGKAGKGKGNAASITQAIQNVNRGRKGNSGVGAVDTSAPGVWENDHVEHWQPDSPYFPAPGWQQRAQQLVEKHDPSIQIPFDRPNFSFNRQFGVAGAEEFWAYRQNDGKQDFGFFVEHLPRVWRYESWAGGSLQAFWTRQAGTLILTRHNKGSDNESIPMDQRGTDHVWGKLASGLLYFSTASCQRGDSPARPEVVSDTKGPHPNVQVKSVFRNSNLEPLPGKATVTHRFEALPDGIRLSKTVASDGADQISELWATIPVYSGEGKIGDVKTPTHDTRIEYWDKSGWKDMTPAIVTATKIRLGKTFNGNTSYGYVVFDAPQRVKLSASVWQATYQSSTRLRNIHIDLHGSPGTARNMPAQIRVDYAIRTVDPGSTRR